MPEFSLQMNQGDSTSTQRGRKPDILSHYPPVLSPWTQECAMILDYIELNRFTPVRQGIELMA
jgi:hypothetical protein